MRRRHFALDNPLSRPVANRAPAVAKRLAGIGVRRPCLPMALAVLAVVYFLAKANPLTASEDWPQLQGDALRSGNAPEISLRMPLGLVAAIPMTDAGLAAPVVSDGKAFVIDGSGVVTAIDLSSMQVVWKFATRGGPQNCNNVAAPAVVGDFVHVGTMAGDYYVLDREHGTVVREIDCQEPVFSAPAVGTDRVYFATLGARVFAVTPRGELVWTWDFVKEVIGFDGDRWSGEQWLAFRGDRVTWRDHFVCSRDLCLVGETVVIPAGGRTVFLADEGDRPRLRRLVKFLSTRATSTPPHSARVPMPPEMCTSSGIGATTRDASRFCGWRVMSSKRVSSLGRKPRLNAMAC